MADKRESRHAELGEVAGEVHRARPVRNRRADGGRAAVPRRLAEHRVPALHLVSGPGAGKTMLLERTLEALGKDLRLAVVTGDVQTQNDADRLSRYTDRLVQAVVTGGACHLDARQIQTSLDAVELDQTDLLFIENVGNLVCPASWDLGETAKVVLCAVTEGEDKPAKYPKMFREARYVVLTKVDLLRFVPFERDKAVAMARDVNPDLQFFFTSATTKEGLDSWFAFLRDLVAKAT